MRDRPQRPDREHDRQADDPATELLRAVGVADDRDRGREQGIGAYGGGQWELGVGRGQIQYLASLFHADNPNDAAPAPYNEPQLPEGLPTSPLDPSIEPAGFRRRAS